MLGKVWPLFGLITLLLFAFNSSASDIVANQSEIRVEIDPRIELMSVIFRLAGNIEYNQCQSLVVEKRVKEYFNKHRNHPAVQKAKELRMKDHIGFDAVMNLAVHVNDINSCEMLLPLHPRPSTLDSRWKVDELDEFLSDCRNFVLDTKFEDYLLLNKKYYDKSCARLQKLVDEKIKLDWFNDTFGNSSSVNFNLALSVLNGYSNYASRIYLNDRKQVYCILGANNIEWFGNGLPKFEQKDVSLVVHEFCHSFCNPIVDKNIDDLSSFGQKFYNKYRKEMKQQAYANWRTMMRESLVRAFEVRYADFIDGENQARKVIHYQESRGFVWTGDLSKVLELYENQRDKYSSFEDYFPEIIRFFNEYTVRK